MSKQIQKIVNFFEIVKHDNKKIFNLKLNITTQNVLNEKIVNFFSNSNFYHNISLIT